MAETPGGCAGERDGRPVIPGQVVSEAAVAVGFRAQQWAKAIAPAVSFAPVMPPLGTVCPLFSRPSRPGTRRVSLATRNPASPSGGVPKAMSTASRRGFSRTLIRT
jgi:hypothetical protein